MNVLTWILSILLALINLGAGGAKLATPRSTLVQNPRMGWAGDFSDGAVKGIGAAEVLGAIGLIVPWATGIAPVLTPIAAVGLAVVQIGAMRTHLGRRERQPLPLNAVLIAVALVIAVIRFAQL